MNIKLYQLTLGELIRELEKVDLDYFLPLAFHEPHSYRGYYAEVAFELNQEGATVGEILSACKKAKEKFFEGYKGGEYTYDDNTPCWIADYGSSGIELSSLLLKFMLAQN